MSEEQIIEKLKWLVAVPIQPGTIQVVPLDAGKAIAEALLLLLADRGKQ